MEPGFAPTGIIKKINEKLINEEEVDEVCVDVSLVQWIASATWIDSTSSRCTIRKKMPEFSIGKIFLTSVQEILTRLNKTLLYST